MNRNLLAKSCNRFVKFVELDSPSCLLVAELALLNKHAFAAIEEALKRETDRRIEQYRAAKAAEATQEPKL